MQRRSSDSKQRLIDSLANHGKSSKPAGIKIDNSTYLRQYYRSVTAEDLQMRTQEQLAAIAHLHLQTAKKREPNQVLIELINPADNDALLPPGRTIVQTVCADMSFVIDTISMVIQSMDLGIYQIFHPILRVHRTRANVIKQVLAEDETAAKFVAESFAHFEIDRVGDPDKLKELEQRIRAALADAQACTRDWQAMRKKAQSIAEELRNNKSPVREKDRLETAELLAWMADDHFTFLGYREYTVDPKQETPQLKPVPRSGLGILRRQKSKSIRVDNPKIQAAIERQINSRQPLIITKANQRATVHRPVHMDYIGVKRFDKNGKATREQRFLGLFTSAAYNLNPRDIPYLRRRVEKVVESFNFPQHSHASKALKHILEAFPRDELFQSSAEDLKRISEGVLGLQERQRVKLFIRRDPYRRFISCMIYVPKEKYSTAVREKIEKILVDGFDGTSIDSKVLITESPLARLQCRVTTPPTHTRRRKLENIEQDIAAAVQTWRGELREELISRLGPAQGAPLFDRYGTGFSAAYEDDFSPYEATFDVERVANIYSGTDIQMALYRPPSFGESHLRFKVFQKDKSIPISDVLPMLEHMGMKVISERPYRSVLGDSTVYVQEFEMLPRNGETINPVEIGQRFQDTFEQTWRGNTESDGFNALIVTAGLTWREAALLRAYCRYLVQTGLPFSQPYMEEVFGKSPNFARSWMELFELKFDPDFSSKNRENAVDRKMRQLRKSINSVESADEDRIFRSFYAALAATLRTNFYQMDADGNVKPYVSFKFDPLKIPGLPKPLPMYEVFVYSARMEGVHLRGGSIARGGIRWSDRREDFRTEVLGLMKAQVVKNTVIVPTGAKGGFVCKRLPTGDRDEIQQEVIRCYKTLIFGLLDITGNIVNDKLIPPSQVVRYDGDDPYLVVAADKGTATFSDIANGISEEYGFWLDDAFASGGSVGYDHKGMGITAKGAWEAVKRHFREIGVDTQNDPFTVAGIGDMGGDVFGNGLLRSRTMKLQAAFNHMHIFIDPDPNPDTGFEERQRLFNLPRSSWEDYNTKLISKGGGIYSRQTKTLPLSPQARAMLDLKDKADPTPDEVIRAILTMQVDLLWNGGIGTYVKAASETNHDAGDRSNDKVRVNGSELRCRVVGEGGNLGLTQLGRIEYALDDGKVNTDFIDNAGGVDCSDREVNIKILLNLAMTRKKLSPKDRNRLLAKMTDEVEVLVLRDNYFQTQAISTLESDSVDRASEHMQFVRMLEQSGELDRELEFLPTDAAILERQRNGRGLTRPELSILLSYSKINLINQLSQSDELNNEYAREDLQTYFPKPLQKKYADLMGDHRLAHEIIATQTANSLVNRMGPTFVVRTQEETGATAGEIARAYTIARETLNLRPLWRSVEALDNEVQARAQYRMLAETSRLLRRAALWLLQRPQLASDTTHAIATFAPAIANLSKNLGGLLHGDGLTQFRTSREIYTDMGVSKTLAHQMAGIRYLYSGYDIAQAALHLGCDDEFVSSVYFRLTRGLRLSWLSEQIERLPVRGRWQALARGTLRENLYEIRRAATISAVNGSKSDDSKIVANSWLENHAKAIERAQRVVTDMRSMGSMDFSTLSVAVQEMRKLVID
ncbi:MAG: NAD-glutamate dehydrogenase [Gammaproteobacteria bacterium]